MIGGQTMQIIDEKGRLFGKINIVDFLVILFLVCIMPAFYFGYKILNRPPVVVEKGVLTSIDVYAILKDLSPEIAKLISVGDKELDDNGNVIGEILDVGKIESNFVEIDLDEEETIVKEDAQKKQVSVKMRVMGELKGNDILYKGNKLKIGSMIDFKTAKYRTKGMIISKISEFSREIKVSKSGLSPINIGLLFKNLSPEVALLVSEGDFETDSDGDTIAKVLAVGKSEPYSYKVYLGDGNYATRTDSQKRQLLVKMEIMGRVEGKTFYFKDKRIALDSKIAFNTNEYSIEGIVAKEPTPVKTSVNLPINIGLLFKNLSPEVALLVSEGDFETDSDGDTIAKVLAVGKSEPYSYKVYLGDGNYATRTDSQKRQLLVKMEIMGRVEGKTFYFKDKRIALDSKIAFNTNEYSIEGIVAKEPVAVKRIDKKWRTLKVKFTNLIPELASLINEGDEERYISGELVARVTSILNNEPTEVTTEVVVQEGGRLRFTKHPVNNKDVILLMKVRCIKAQKGLFFKESRVKVGSNLSLQTEEYDINGVIIEIEGIEDL